MRKTLYLHIGAPKTGTSSLQHYLTANRDWLGEQGVLYPASTLENHHPLSLSIIKAFSDWRRPFWPSFEGTAEGLWQDFREELDRVDCPTVVVSSEHFCSFAHHHCRAHAAEMANWLGKRLEGLDVHVVCYLRPLGDQVQSQYKQIIKESKDTRTFAEHLETQLALNSIHVYPSAYLDLFARQFGTDKLILRTYDRNQLVGGSTIDDFLHLLELSRQDAHQPASSFNLSLNNDLVDAKRIFTAMSGVSDTEVQQIGERMACANAGWFGARPADGGHAIKEALQREHQAIRDRYGLDLGEDSDPFAGLEQPTESDAGAVVLSSLLWKELGNLRTESERLKSRIGQLDDAEAMVRRIEKLVDRRTSLRKRLRRMVGKVRSAFKKHRGTQK